MSKLKKWIKDNYPDIKDDKHITFFFPDSFIEEYDIMDFDIPLSELCIIPEKKDVIDLNDFIPYDLFPDFFCIVKIRYIGKNRIELHLEMCS